MVQWYKLPCLALAMAMVVAAVVAGPVIIKIPTVQRYLSMLQGYSENSRENCGNDRTPVTWPYI